MNHLDHEESEPFVKRHWFRRLLLPIVVISIFAMLMSLLLPRPGGGRAAPSSICSYNLRTLVLALRSYHDDYGSFPPAYTADTEGRRLHSWRTLILRHVFWQPLYERIRLDEPWDSPHNLATFGYMDGWPDIFGCPSDRNYSDGTFQTNYLAIVGPSTMWPEKENESRRHEDVTDGESETIMIVEVADSGISFFEPRDLQFDELSFQINDPQGLSPSSLHNGIINVAFADGRVRSLAEDTSPEQLRAMLTVNCGETIILE